MLFKKSTEASINATKDIFLVFILLVTSELLPLVLSPYLGYDQKNAIWLAKVLVILPLIWVCLKTQGKFLSNDRSHVKRCSKKVVLWLLLAFLSALSFFVFMKCFETVSEGALLRFRMDVYSLNGFPLVAFLLLFHALIPAFEELLFRGILFFTISVRFNRVSGCLVSSVVFAAIHPSRFFFMLLFGLCACLIVYRSGKLYPAVFMHVLYNIKITSDALL